LKCRDLMYMQHTLQVAFASLKKGEKTTQNRMHTSNSKNICVLTFVLCLSFDVTEDVPTDYRHSKVCVCVCVVLTDREGKKQSR
jgi:hypothetical protein